MIYQEVIFTKEECEKIISYKEVYTDLIWRSLEPVIDIENRRIDQHTYTKGGKKFGKFFNVWDIQNDSNTFWVFERVLKWFSSVSNIELNFEQAKKIQGGSLLKYSKGDLFQKHMDLTIGHENRRWNLGIQLNEEYTGGEYIGYNNDNEILISPKTGTAVAYDSTTYHEIKEITSGERYSLVICVINNMIIQKKHLL